MSKYKKVSKLPSPDIISVLRGSCDTLCLDRDLAASFAADLVRHGITFSVSGGDARNIYVYVDAAEAVQFACLAPSGYDVVDMEELNSLSVEEE